MADKKNIDQLFKERFEEFEATPPPHVWENIQAQLQEKKKDRKVIPLWWKVGGVAALLALMFTIGSSVWDATNTNTIVEGDSEKIENIKEENHHSPLIDTNKQIIESTNAQDVAEGSINENTIHEISSSEIVVDNNNSSSQKTPQTITNLNSVANQNISAQKNSIFETNTNSVIPSNNTNTATTKKTNAITQNNASVTQTTGITINNQTQKNSIDNKQGVQNSNPLKTTVSKEGIAQNGTLGENVIDTDKINSAVKKENGSIVSEVIIAEENTSEEKKTDVDANKKSIFDAIDEQNKAKTEDAVVKNDSPKNRWEVAPNFAPVFYNTLSEGSSIDASFSDNSKNGDVNFSYGVGVSYAVSERLSIRTGVSNVDVSYSTGGLELGNGPVSAALTSVAYNRSQSVLIPQDKGTIESQNPDGTFGEITLKSTSGEAFLNQNISYYEVPLELKYALFNTKLGVNIIGGLSTLFLGDNEVSVTAGDFNETLGEANNLSNVSFSTNVGLGFDYKLSSKFKFNVEPMFKYQLNPYTDSSVNFKPYYVGVYTGLSFKF